MNHPTQFFYLSSLLFFLIQCETFDWNRRTITDLSSPAENEIYLFYDTGDFGLHWGKAEATIEMSDSSAIVRFKSTEPLTVLTRIGQQVIFDIRLPESEHFNRFGQKNDPNALLIVENAKPTI